MNRHQKELNAFFTILFVFLFALLFVTDSNQTFVSGALISSLILFSLFWVLLFFFIGSVPPSVSERHATKTKSWPPPKDKPPPKPIERM